MRISYCGRTETCDERAAEIDYSYDEYKIVDKMSVIAMKETDWKWSLFLNGHDDGCAYIRVKGHDDYEEFKEYYLDLKKRVRGERKS